MIKSYSELVTLNTFEERYEYLKIGGFVGQMTFGGYREVNQMLYKNSSDWRRVRDQVIVRDEGCDLAIPDRPIIGVGDYKHPGLITPKIIVHHINPITLEDVMNNPYKFFDMDNLVCTSLITHNAIHYGKDVRMAFEPLTTRKPNDTCPWRGAN